MDSICIWIVNTQCTCKNTIFFSFSFFEQLLADGDVMLWGQTQTRPGFAVASCVDMPSSCAGNTNSIILRSHNMTKHYIQHGPLGCERISNAPKPISSELKFGGSHSKVKSVEWNQGKPPFYFEMRLSHPRGL